MSIRVPSFAELEALEKRLAKLEALAAVQAPSGYVRGRDLPGGSRRWRRLREAGKITGFRIDGRGRELFYRVADVAGLMLPAEAEPEAKPTEAETAEPCTDPADYAERNLKLLTGGRAA